MGVVSEADPHIESADDMACRRADRAMFSFGVMCIASAALLYAFVTQPKAPMTAQAHPSVTQSTATP